MANYVRDPERAEHHELRVTYPDPKVPGKVIWVCWCGRRGQATRGFVGENDARMFQKARDNHGAHRRRMTNA